MANKIFKVLSGKYAGCIGTVQMATLYTVNFYPLDNEKYPAIIRLPKNRIGNLYKRYN